MTTRVHFRVWPNDLDFNVHVNNGRYLALADIGRIHWFVRTGVLGVARQHKAWPMIGEHLADMAVFSLATGLRAANVTGLQWSQGDLPRQLAWIHPDQAKARRAIAVPLNAEALAVAGKQIGKHRTHVFSFRGKPVRWVSTKAWHAALKRAGIEDFRWHDLRHTWASWHVQNGTAVRVAGVGRLGITRDGASLRASRRGTPRSICAEIVCLACR